MDKNFWRNKAIEHGVELMKVKKQLEIAIEALTIYADVYQWDIDTFCGDLQTARKALNKIKELDNKKEE